MSERCVNFFCVLGAHSALEPHADRGSNRWFTPAGSYEDGVVTPGWTSPDVTLIESLRAENQALREALGETRGYVLCPLSVPCFPDEQEFVCARCSLMRRISALLAPTKEG